MAMYFMFGEYTLDSIRRISGDRTKEAVKLIEKSGGKVHAMYVLLGDYDLVIIADFPGTKEVMKASIALSRQTDIGFTTAPALRVEEFDELIAKS